MILVMFIFHLALPDKTFSKEERRYLAQWPVFQIETVLNGSYESKVESYFSDQFPFRNVWVHIRFYIECLTLYLCIKDNIKDNSSLYFMF